MLFDIKKYDWLDEYLSKKCGAVKDLKIEWEWFRYQVGDKMFAALCLPDESHELYAGKNILTLKCESMTNDFLCKEYEYIHKGFYMNKQNWISIDLEGDLPREMIFELCDTSYNLVFSKLTKKKQNEITENNHLSN